MNQSSNFVGQHLLGQILGLARKDSLREVFVSHKANRYYKQLKVWEHFVAMMYGVLSNCTSLREIVLGLASFEGKLAHLNMSSIPARSTLSDGNKKRSSKVFQDIYYLLYERYKPCLSDSTKLPKAILKNLFLMDSSVFQLFKAILKTTGRTPLDGRKKGGIKKNTVIHGGSLMPVLVRFTSAATHDQQFYNDLKLAAGSYVVFDKGYTCYRQYALLTAQGINFVTRQKENAQYESLGEIPPSAKTPKEVLKDERIKLNYKNDKKEDSSQELRRVVWWVEKENRSYEFFTNNFELPAQTIAQLYQYRWKIELFFKKLKQNFPLEYFVGDNQNAIEIQIWCALIALLLISVIHHQHHSKMAFSVCVSLFRQHLFNYILIAKIFELAEKKRVRKLPPTLDLFNST